ncbi:MAG: hypothetical protein ABII76_28375, partial [Pseudomonadota bacterium]
MEDLQLGIGKWRGTVIERPRIPAKRNAEGVQREPGPSAKSRRRRFNPDAPARSAAAQKHWVGSRLGAPALPSLGRDTRYRTRVPAKRNAEGGERAPGPRAKSR